LNSFELLQIGITSISRRQYQHIAKRNTYTRWKHFTSLMHA